MKKISWILILTLASLLATFSIVQAQGEELKLGMSRDWGYGGFGNDIQGTFSLKASGPANLARVEFFIDETKIGEVSQAPYNLQFLTDNYPAGLRSLYAVGTTRDGKQLTSNKISAVFLSKADADQKSGTIILPILVLVFGALILSAVVSMVTGRKNKNLPAGAPRSYPMGGGICKKCGRPFAFQLFSMNMVIGKLVRCPYCGKWGVVRHASIDKLHAAEQAELEREKAQIPEASAEEKLKKELDDSRFSGL
jgi:hypothetical protein